MDMRDVRLLVAFGKAQNPGSYGLYCNCEGKRNEHSSMQIISLIAAPSANAIGLFAFFRLKAPTAGLAIEKRRLCPRMDCIKLVLEQLAVAVRAPALRNAFDFRFIS